MKLRSKFLLGILALSMVFTHGAVFASERVAMKSPAMDAAYVPFLLGMVNNHKTKDLYGVPKTVHDGIVIRQSSIKDGKIIIPPGGLYVTSRSGNWLPFRAAPMTIAGTEYFVITDLYERNVLQNITLKKGEIVPVNAEKTRGFELSVIEMEPYGIPGQNAATIKFVKATGNYYGSSFPVYSGDMITNIPNSDFSKTTGEKAGITVPTAKNKLANMMYASNMSSVGRTHVIVGDITKDSVEIRELATDSATDLFVTSTPPSVKTVKKGDSFKMGTAKVDIIAVGKDTVTVKLTDGKGKVEKLLGPYDAKNTEWLSMSMTARDPFWIQSSDGTVIVTLDLFKKDGPFGAKSASIVAYDNVINVQNTSEWAADPRFVAIPET